MKTSIIILTYNNLKYSKLCIESIREYTLKGLYEIIVVDNKSTDGTVQWLKCQKDIKKIYNNVNLGFSKGCNQGIKVSSGENVLLLNNDVIVTSNWLKNLKECLYSSERIGAVGPVTNNCSNYQRINVNYSSIREMQVFAKKYNLSNPQKWEIKNRLIGFCFLIKKEVINKIGFLDERFTPGNFEDDDYSMRIKKAGYKLILCRDTFIHHYGSVSFMEPSRNSNLLALNKKKLEDKWKIKYEDLIR